MAYYHYGEESDRRPGRSRHAHPTPHVDWLETGDTVHDSLPRRTRRGHIIQYADEPPSSMRRSQTTWSERSSPAQVATMPLRTRAATVTTMTMPVGRGVDHHRHQPHHHRASRHYEDEDEEDDVEDEDEDEDGDESPAGSRRDLRRGMSPRSVRHYRSTPESRKDSRPSQPDSDGESDTTVSTEDIRHQDLEKHGQLQRRARHPEPDDYLDHREEDRRWRRRQRRGTVVYDTQDEDPTPHQSAIDHKSPIRHLSRHSSRRSADLVESGSSVRRGYHSRSQSLLEAPTPPRSSVSRPRRRRHSQVIYTEIVPPTLRRAHTASETHVTSHSTTSSNRRHSVLGAFLGPGMQGQGSDRRVKQKFKMSIKDPVEMPPKCCAEHIPLKHVERLLSTDFKKTWNRKFAEFSTRNRVYCPAKRCGEWIKPANIHREDGRKCGKCSRCKLKVCCACNGKWHGSRECPRDEETTIFLQQAKDAGWQRCHRCKAIVELKEGCNHMTCRCGAEFCMICGLKWKSCDCPWFNHDTPEDDRLEDMHIPMSLGRDRLGRADGSPPGRGTIHPVPDLTAPMSMRPRVPDAYEGPSHDPLMRRLQERQESNLARRLHVRDDDGGDMSAHHRGDDHRRRPHLVPVPVPTAPAAPPVGFERPGVAGEGGWAPGSDIGMMMSGGIGGGYAPPPPAPMLPPQVPEVHGSRGQKRGGEPKSSMMAGLTGAGRGMNRVDEWRSHVEPGVPGDDRSLP
ncbi:conserved hypothetical protein [Verticillium alfalfae VaMs.102]|uniref:RBR-type E3 ubiquitin transferase n=1 Tax=Verticillium alfalfae (strain VaMs.102 / ATCC MYA-4576 / FGSC 10136) TaxID=526221 RepID=C9S7F2_VERA1|nr:conserved hypothetical protein [Verticillium alfalfae VaMs.102]EEY14713.1 conserved hypothetical protein [Verticillium alfalfae VaMs.102]